jgi:carbamoyl-phosphate synthase small subunit
MKSVVEAALVLADGEVFEGEAIGAVPSNGVAAGEVVFNTVLSGYQEVITDPSYAGQIITFTYPRVEPSVLPRCRGSRPRTTSFELACRQ